MKKSESGTLAELYAEMGQSVFDSFPIGLVLSGPQGRIQDANRTFCAFLGYTHRELTRRTVREITHPADRGITARTIRQAGTPAPISLQLEKRYLHKSGKIVWGETHVRSFRAPLSGRLRHAAYIIDITERKKAEADLQRREQDFKTLADNAPDLVVRFDRKLRHLYVNPATEAITGLKSQDFIGKTNKELGVPPLLETIGSRALRRVLKTGQPEIVEFKMATPQGPRVLESRIAPEFAANGSVKNMVCITRDITDQKRLQEALEKSHTDLERKIADRTSRLRALAGELTRIEQQERRRIAHILHEDLQQILVALKFQLGTPPGKGRKRLSHYDPERAVEMVDAALKVTRSLCMGLTPPILHDLGLKSALEWLAGDLRHTMGLTVTIDSPPFFRPLSDDIRAFAFSAIREILTNVIKHAGIKTAHIHAEKIPGGKIRISIEDRGIGFIPHLENGRTFGLFSIRERAAALGGQLDIDSAPGRGTRVSLTLPLEVSRAMPSAKNPSE